MNPNDQSRQQTHLHHRTLDPTIDGIQPRGMEMQRYQAVPRSVNDPSALDLAQMTDLIKQSHIINAKDIIHTQRQTAQNVEELGQLRDAMANDLQTLQKQLHDVTVVVTSQQHVSAARDRQSLQDVQVTDEMKTFSQSFLADAYRSAANDSGDMAAALRAKADDFTSGANTHQSHIEARMLESPRSENESGPKTPTPLSDLYRSRYAVGRKPSGLLQTQEEEHEVHVNVSRSVHHIQSTADYVKKASNAGDNRLDALDGHLVAGQLSPPSTLLGSDSRDDTMWQPLAVHQMPPVATDIPSSAIETFTWEDINLKLNGEQWSPGFYRVKDRPSTPGYPLTGSTYWLLEGTYEPYAPSAPGQHGAKLTAFFNPGEIDAEEAPEPEDYDNIPVFICPSGQDTYTYFGHYRQGRFSDKLDYDTLHTHVPRDVLLYWAEQLVAPERPEWLTLELMNHFWPKPHYSGRIFSGNTIDTAVTADTDLTLSSAATAIDKKALKHLAEYAEESHEWEREARMKANMLTVQNLMDAYHKADAAEEPGLRLQWEYLECVGWDQTFYHSMVDLKRGVNPWRVGEPRRANKIKTARNGVSVGTNVIGDDGKVTSHNATVPFSRQTTAVNGPQSHADIFEAGGNGAEASVKQHPGGDLDLAKQMREDFHNSKNGGRGGQAGPRPQLFLPPHRR